MKYIRIKDYIYDILFYCKNNFVNNNNNYSNNCNINITINKDLWMFFYPNKYDISFLDNLIIGNNFVNFEYISEKIKNNDLFEILLKFYSNDNIDYNSISINNIFSIINKLIIPDQIKLKLIDFSFNRNQYKNLLIDELIILNKKFEQYYNSNFEYTTLLENKLQENIDFYINKANYNEIYYYISLVNKEILSINYLNNISYIIIGEDQLNNINSPKNFDFNFITKVLSDELRINILNLLKEKGEMNTTEIAKAFDKKLASIFYHLDLMQQANIVTIRNEGRKVIYNLNIQFFENLGTYIKTFSTNDNVML